MANLNGLTINDSGFLGLPSGTTVERPASPSTGYLRVNTDFNVVEVFDGSFWRDVQSNVPIINEDFSSNSLDTNLWGVFGNSFGSVTVSNGECEIRNSTGGSDDNVALYSEFLLPVGSKLTVRSKNTQGRHAAVLGFGNSPYYPYPHARSQIGTTWYSRADDVSSTVSFKDENNETNTSNGVTQDLRSYQVFELRRRNDFLIEYYRNGTLEYSNSSRVFANEYPVYISADGWSNTNVSGLDNVIVVDYIKVEPI